MAARWRRFGMAVTVALLAGACGAPAARSPTTTGTLI
jgi:hypothetical protein